MNAPQRAIVFGRIKPRRAFEEICERIRDQLSAGGLRPGDKLPPERELALQLGVGRNAVREAMRSLEFAGVLELRKGTKGGAFIRQGDPGAMTQVLQDLIHLGSVSLDELTEARLHILDVVIRIACSRATKADLQALRDNVDRTERVTLAGDYLARLDCSQEFYRLLSATTKNQALCLLVESLTEVLMKYLRASVAAGARVHPDLVQTRRHFIDLVEARDVDGAIREMRRHLEAVHRLLTGSKVNRPAAAPRAPAAKRKAAAKE